MLRETLPGRLTALNSDHDTNVCANSIRSAPFCVRESYPEDPVPLTATPLGNRLPTSLKTVR